MNELATNFNATQLALLGTLIVGVTELLTRLRAKDLWTVATILSAALLGGLVGLYYHVDFIAGVTGGLSASGALKTLSVLGKGGSPSKNTDVVAQ